LQDEKESAEMLGFVARVLEIIGAFVVLLGICIGAVWLLTRGLKPGDVP
jgi:hypothetical protein